jgi:hypothetical protein
VFSLEVTLQISNCERSEKFVNENGKSMKTRTTCQNKLGSSFWAPNCIFVKDKYGSVLDCRRMYHLHTCKEFVCLDGYIKCHNTYCTPHYILDGEEDCPAGEDEYSDSINPCKGNFVCWESKMCLHLDRVCDRHPDCPHRDDEIDCRVECDNKGGLEH